MFDPNDLKSVVDLHQKSYLLLQWAARGLQTGTLSFSIVHSAMGFTEAAEEWIGRNLHSFPPEMRPDERDIERFAHLFASYLQTSFDLIEEPGQKRDPSKFGCYCRFCSCVVSASHLKVRKPGKRAPQKAQEMKRAYLAGLAEEVGVANPNVSAARLLSEETLVSEIAHATYAKELSRRSEFASQGEGVLVLWREIAWDERGRLKKGITLSAERILQAEDAILRVMTG